jgi:hypothetical protein
MPYLSTQAKHLISRLSNNNLLGMIQNLAFCLETPETDYFSPSSIKSQWFDQEISALQPEQKRDLIKEILELVEL